MPTSNATAVVFEQPGQIAVRPVALLAPTAADCTVEVHYSGISTGTERLLWNGRMPPFPGLAYPLVPGYESVGRIVAAGADSPLQPGQRVFVPGSSGFADVRGLFGGTASHLVVPAARLVALEDSLGEDGILLALAATAYHAVTRGADGRLPQLIIGHGVLGRLIARTVLALGGAAPTVWETQAARRSAAAPYPVVDPATDSRSDYAVICDVSGDAGVLDTLVGRLARGGEIVLAGFYEQPLNLTFPPAFMREARLSIAAEWQPADLEQVLALVEAQRLSLAGLITHRQGVGEAAQAYATAFGDADCLKMMLDWSLN